MKNEETIGQLINRLAKTDTSSEEDSQKMQYILQKLGFNYAKVVCGIAYMEGKGFPVSIHTLARKLKQACEGKKIKW